MAIAALILGVLSVVFLLFYFFPLFSIVLGIIGIVLAVLARKEAKTPQATAGLVLSVIGVSIGLIFTAVCILSVIGFYKILDHPAGPVGQLRKSIEEAQRQNPETMKIIEEESKSGLEETGKAL